MVQRLAEPQRIPSEAGPVDVPYESQESFFFESSLHPINSSDEDQFTKFPTLPALPQRRTNRRPVRSQNTIEAAILDACRTPTVQHWVMVKARLGYDTFWKHMNRLLSMGAMDETSEGSKTLYIINAKGVELLEQLSRE
jgi:predicted transcriptional regulator